MTDQFTAPDALEPEPEPDPSKPRRSKDGRPYIYCHERGREVLRSRVTTFIDCLDDKSVLGAWGERKVLEGLALDPLLLRQLGDLDFEDKGFVNDYVVACKEAAGYRDAAQLGTDTHAATELFDQTGSFAALDHLDASMYEDVLAYSQTMEDFGVEVLDIERFVVNDLFGCGGTLDRIVEFRGKRMVGDIKTGRIDYGQAKIAMQMALYANSSGYDARFPEEREPLDVDLTTGLLIHLPAGQADCRLYLVDLTVGWEGVVLADQVRKFRSKTTRKGNGLLEDLQLSFDG